MQRIDQITEPPIVGRYYLVPTVFVRWHHKLSHWPVIGPPHEDKEFFNFDLTHYHIDGRFLNADQRQHAEYYSTLEYIIESAPLHADRYDPTAVMPKPVYMKKRCWSANLDYVHHHQKPVQEVAKAFVGHQCVGRGKAGWICPHRKASLGSVMAIDGVITCPLHGLRINAESGVVINP
jgi:hypothetical protein